MFDVAIEFLRAVVLCGILAFFVYADNAVQHGRRGYLFIKLGFLLVVFGAIMDITDNFESLNWTVVAGDTPVQAVLEKIVGYLGGFSLLAVGFWRWLPSLRKLALVQTDLEESKRNLEHEVLKRTHELEREVRKRQIAEADLLVAADRRQGLYEHAPVAIVHGIIGGNRLECNEAFAELLGYDSQGELAATMAEHRDPFLLWPYREDRDRMIDILKREKHIRNFEARLRRKGGDVFWASIDFSTLEDREGENYYYYAFAKDITEQRQETECLAESEKRLRILMDSMPAGLYLVDVETQEISDVNVAMLAMTGYGREELVGRHCCEKLCPAEKGACPILDEGAEIVCRERKIKVKDGSEMPVVKTVTRVTINDREYLLEAFIDISEQKRLEHLKKDVDRIVAHDLKAPIVAVVNACKVLLMNENGVESETRDMLEIIERQGRKVLGMIGMSLTMYKMEGGTYSYEPQQLDFMEVLRNVCSGQESTAEVAGVSISITSGDGEFDITRPLEVFGEVMLYENMLDNLMANAIEASPPGGDVVVSLSRCPDMVMTIRNSGAVPPDMRDVFFDKGATSGKSAGTGLGTYSAKLVADTVGGEIAMSTSDEDDSTTVAVKLPCV